MDRGFCHRTESDLFLLLLTRIAYPGATKSMVNVLFLNYFTDAFPDSDVRLRLRKVGQTTITEAESKAVRLEA